ALLLPDPIRTGAVGPSPIHGAPVAVELAKPRSASELLHDDHAADVRAHVVATLTKDLERSRAVRGVARCFPPPPGLRRPAEASAQAGQPRVLGPERAAFQVAPETEG